MNKLFYILIILFSSAQLIGQTEEKIALNKGVEAYKKGNFSEALAHFNKANTTNADYKKAVFNAANAALLIDSIEIAKDLYTEYASATEDKIEKSKAYYNLGNAQFKEYEKLAKDPKKAQKSTKVLKESIESYKKALRNNYKDADARHNLSLAMSKLPTENEQKDKDDQNKDGEDDKENKEDQENKENQENKDNKDGEKSDDKKDGEKSDEEGKEGENGDDKKEEGDKKEGEGKKGKNQEKKEEEEGGKDSQQGKEGDKEEEEVKGKISRMQAQKDLDAMNNEEQKTLMKVNRKKGKKKKENSSSKDW